MTVTAQQIYDAGIQRSTANNTGLLSGAEREVLRRINYAQQRLYTLLAQENRYFNVSQQNVSSTDAPDSRLVDLNALDPACERLLLVKLPNDVPISQVDMQDLEAEYAPRFFPRGTSIVEVASDWGAAGVISVGLTYAFRPAALNLAGDLAQLVSVPDRFCEWLEIDLAMYIAGKDFGRAESSPSEIKTLESEALKVLGTFHTFLDHFPGPSSRRFILPVPTDEEKA